MATKPESSPELLENAKAYLNKVSSTRTYQGWDKELLQSVEATHASPGRVEFEFTVIEEMCNPLGILHGGCAATILDDLSSTALYTLGTDGKRPGQTVSRTLSLTYLRALPIGTRVRCVNEVIHSGKSLATLSARLETLDGKWCVACTHDKAVLKSKL
ncbi:hypothetical protein FQN57_000194 [Myotisia sp. PD_48]|nr:hypothetical protein FQN57_000194 [Myotisia sp. PD_48]